MYYTLRCALIIVTTAMVVSRSTVLWVNRRRVLRMECTTPPLYNPVTGASENRLLLAVAGRIGTLLML